MSATLNKQIWLSQLKEKFYPDSSFLQFVSDFSAFTNNDTINLAEAGLDPVVLINNNTYPIAINSRVDVPIQIPLDTFETENTSVRRPEVIEYAYDQLESVLRGHRESLRVTTSQKAAHAYAPDSDSAFTPVIPTTGEDNGDGKKSMTVEDVLTLKDRFDEKDVPMDDRFLVMHPKHIKDLILFDTKSFKDITDFVNGQPKRFAGFNILQYTRNPLYNKSTLVKKAFGAATLSTDTYCSFAFQKGEVMKADGAVYMYSRIDDPEERATIVGFDKRFIALPIRNKGIGSIVSVDVD